jgi:3-oxoacyl-[acyl-carrier protein] reductase
VTANAIRPRAATRLTMSPEMEAARKRRLEMTAKEAAEAPAESSAQDAISRIDQMKPELVAPLVVYLCTDEAANVNGRDFLVGGNEVSLMSLPVRERTIYREGGWTVDSLAQVFPSTIGDGLVNPKPAEKA